MKTWIAGGVALLVMGQAHAQDLQVKPLLEARLRWEHADQAGATLASDAVTTRVRAGAAADLGAFSALVEAQGTFAPVDDYYDGLNGGAAARPLIADPENIAIARAQLRYRAGALTLTAGRQGIALDDERFVGSSGFRQNAQSFDAARAEWRLGAVKADLSYVWSVRTIWGVDGAGARQRAVSGDTFLVNLSARTPLGTLTGFGYLIDQDEVAVQGYRLSSQTYGGRLAGTHGFAAGVRASWQFGFARQSDYARNPNRYRADYWRAEAGLDLGDARVGVGYEVLGASNGIALTSFQTPLATGFKFQGWADKFLVTPPDGVRDLYASAGYALPLASGRAITFQAMWHRFESDRLVRHYGDEWDLLATTKLGRTQLSARYADYRADQFATSTRRFWLQLDWAL